MSVQKNAPKIVSSGLVLYMDPLNARSYPGSGTIVTNIISRVGYTMNSGITVSGNAFSFNAANSGYIDLGPNFTPPIYTKSVWMKTPIGSPLNIISGSAGEVFYGSSGSIQMCNTWQSGVVTATMNFYDNVWHNIVGTYDGTNGYIYMDGVFIAQGPMNAPVNRNTYIGRYDTANYLTAQIGVIKIYNRVLTANEIIQNFNAQKGRFGY